MLPVATAHSRVNEQRGAESVLVYEREVHAPEDEQTQERKQQRADKKRFADS